MIVRNTLKTIIRKVFETQKYILFIHIITTTLPQKGELNTMTPIETTKTTFTTKILSNIKGEITVTNDTQN